MGSDVPLLEAPMVYPICVSGRPVIPLESVMFVATSTSKNEDAHAPAALSKAFFSSSSLHQFIQLYKNSIGVLDDGSQRLGNTR